ALRFSGLSGRLNPGCSTSRLSTRSNRVSWPQRRCDSTEVERTHDASPARVWKRAGLDLSSRPQPPRNCSVAVSAPVLHVLDECAQLGQDLTFLRIVQKNSWRGDGKGRQ